ncbi:uncharacterized protein HMPREF1541_07461 [Cyphellophora europaea CBS 101466]|uniref:Uncharacterized protein n=1 Tax=Cyphellophora europaea (strain CBS 101466) TaxID=1220924 RepID=W2RQ50_CYPE1|nr:uncharacterized protein HMPREF1541_07461 [Cyphellophora europaea CBS 101466]ETN37838.1 hypothetical protein HMPREF1541_07461 [Cyphellophora europaea CBS 101466]
MKSTAIFVLAALAAQTVSAVPHRRDHKILHQARAEAGAVTVTKTIVEPSAVVWVDDAGNTVSTEYRGSPATAAPEVNNKVGPAIFAGNVQPAVPNVNRPVSSTSASPGSNTGASVGATGNGGYGICYDMINAQTQCKTADQVNQDFAFLSQNGYKMVRTYDVGCNIGIVATAAAAHGMKVFAGINSISNVAGDLQKLINYINGNWAAVDTVNIGNEQVNQGAASASQVTAAVAQGRAMLQKAGFSGNVVTVDVFNQFIANPSLGSNSDYIAANAHGFFDTTNSAANNGNWLQKEYTQLKSIANGKKVVITESGWPHAGSANGGASADPGSQSTAIAAIKTAFADKQDSLYVFQAYDAKYKQPGAMGIEQSFGLFGSN